MLKLLFNFLTKSPFSKKVQVQVTLLHENGTQIFYREHLNKSTQLNQENSAKFIENAYNSLSSSNINKSTATLVSVALF